MVLSRRGLPSFTIRGRPSGPTTVCFPPPAPLAQEGLEVRLELREGLALGLCAVHGVGDVTQNVEAGGLGDREHLGVLGALELEPGPGGQRPGASAPKIADGVARRQAEGLGVRRHGVSRRALDRRCGDVRHWKVR